MFPIQSFLREIEDNDCAKFWEVNNVNYGLYENGEWLPINRPRFHKQVKGNSEVGYLQLYDNGQSRSGNTETETFEKAGGPVSSIKTYRNLANS